MIANCRTSSADLHHNLSHLQKPVWLLVKCSSHTRRLVGMHHCHETIDTRCVVQVWLQRGVLGSKALCLPAKWTLSATMPMHVPWATACWSAYWCHGPCACYHTQVTVCLPVPWCLCLLSYTGDRSQHHCLIKPTLACPVHRYGIARCSNHLLGPFDRLCSLGCTNLPGRHRLWQCV